MCIVVWNTTSHHDDPTGIDKYQIAISLIAKNDHDNKRQLVHSLFFFMSISQPHVDWKNER